MTKENVLKAIEEAHTAMKDKKGWCLCIPSYTRPLFAFSSLLKRCSQEFLDNKVRIFVHQDELEKYKKANPNLSYVVVPEEYYGVGYTREFINLWAIENNYSILFDWDDDIKNLTFMYASTDCYGNPSTKHSSKGDEQSDSLFTEKLLCYTAYISDYLFVKYPYLRLGNVRRQRFCGDVSVHQTLANVNKGATPRQTNIWNLRDYVKGKYFIESTRWHGDDIISSARVLEENEGLFSIQQVGYDFVSEQVNSTLRDSDENTPFNRNIHKKEYEDLQKLEIRNYLKTSKAYSDGAYMYGDIDWRRYYALHPERKGFSVNLLED